MILELIRIRHDGQAIDGQLIADGQKLCDTAENSLSCLPAGTYIVERHYCKQYGRYVPKILAGVSTCAKCPRLKGIVSNNTPMPCVCHQLKMGNGIYKRLDGSIIIGTAIVPGCLMFTRNPYELLSERIRKIAGRGNLITLTIKEDYKQ